MTPVAATPQQLPEAQRRSRTGRERLVLLLVRGCATTAIVFGAPLNLRTLATFGPPR